MEHNTSQDTQTATVATDTVSKTEQAEATCGLQQIVSRFRPRIMQYEMDMGYVRANYIFTVYNQFLLQKASNVFCARP